MAEACGWGSERANGEHGISMVTPWSYVGASGKELPNYPQNGDLEHVLENGAINFDGWMVAYAPWRDMAGADYPSTIRLWARFTLLFEYRVEEVYKILAESIGIVRAIDVQKGMVLVKGECRTLRKPLAARRSKSYKGAVLAGSSMASGITTVGQFDNKRGCGLPFLRTKKDSVKLVRRSLFQDVNQTKTLFAETGEAAAVQSDSSQIGSDGAQVTNTNIAPSDEVVGTWNAVTEAAMSPSEEEAYLEAGIADYEQEDTLLYSEEDLLDDLAFRAAVANVQTIYAADREKINAEFAQNLQKCRVARQVKPPAGPSKPSSRSNTPIRAVSFKKALAMKVMSLRKTPKQKIAKEGTLKDKDKSPMKF